MPFGYGSWPLLKQLWIDWSSGWAPPVEDLARVQAAFSESSVLNAAVSYYRVHSEANEDRLDMARKALSQPILVPVLGLVGTKDGCVKPSVFRASMVPALFTNTLDIVEFDRLGHFLHLQEPGKVSAKIVQHLLRSERGTK